MDMTTAGLGFALLATAAVFGLLWYRTRRALLACNHRAETLQEEIKTVRTLDETTGTFNYNVFVKAANVQIKLAHRHRWPVSLMIVDIHRLERYNLRHGFKRGDAILRHLADSIRAVLRSSDVLGRFGGSGFYILLPECDSGNVPVVFGRIMRRIEREPLVYDGEPFAYRCFAGAVTMYGMHAYLNEMSKLAQTALETAKEREEALVVFDQEGTEVRWK